MDFPDIPFEEKQTALENLRRVKADFAGRGWFPGMSGSLSARVGSYSPDRFHFAITAGSKNDPANPPEGNFLFVNTDGKPCEVTGLMPIDDTPIHAKIYRMTGCGAIFHVHTVFNSLLSEYYGDLGYVPARDIELIKELGIWADNTVIQIPVLPNFSVIAKIAKQIPEALKSDIPGLLLRSHGIYVWGCDIVEAKRRLEAFEFIFEVLYRQLMLPPK